MPAKPPSPNILLEALLDDFDELRHLECDGFSRVATYVLKTNGISHTVYSGRCSVGDKVVDPHFWIKSGRYIIDYRLRMWAGPDSPHGVFEASEHPSVQYDGEPTEFEVSSVLFQILLETPAKL